MQRPPMHIPFSGTIKSIVINHVAENYYREYTKGWTFSKYRKDTIQSETNDWFKYYLPVDLKGKVVLDVGAGEGESALFFLRHGASHVYCIECCDYAFQNLKLNARNCARITPIHKLFDLQDLERKVDFLKMDIEGYEEVLLSADIKIPAVVEVHGLQLRDKFKSAGWQIKSPTFVNTVGYGSAPGCTCYAYINTQN